VVFVFLGRGFGLRFVFFFFFFWFGGVGVVFFFFFFGVMSYSRGVEGCRHLCRLEKDWRRRFSLSSFFISPLDYLRRL